MFSKGDFNFTSRGPFEDHFRSAPSSRKLCRPKSSKFPLEVEPELCPDPGEDSLQPCRGLPMGRTAASLPNLEQNLSSKEYKLVHASAG